MENLDNHIEGDFDSENPANIDDMEVELSDLEQLQFDNKQLEEKLKIEKQRKYYKIWQLKKLAEIEKDLSTFGTITYEQQKEKQEILNQYL